MRLRWIMAAVLALSAAACGSDGGDDGGAGGASDDGGSTAEESSAAAVYEGELADGSTLVIHLDVPADHPAVEPFEEFRALTGADEPTWIVGEITVPDDVDGNGRFVTFLAEGADPLEDDPADPDDGVTNSDFVCSVLDEWFQAAEPKDEALNDAYLEVYEEVCDGQTLQVVARGGETTTYVMVYDGPLPDFETIEAELGNSLDKR